MPDSMRFDNNGQPMGYGDPMDPYGQYAQQGGYPGAMPSPQDIYAQQSYADPAMQQPYADPNQMYMDPNQAMYGAQPMQPDPYGQYQQQPYMDPNAGMGAMPGAYPEMDPAMGAPQPYMEPDPQFMQQPVPGYGQQAAPQQAQQPYPGMQAQPYGQMAAAQPAPQPMAAPQQPQAAPEQPLDKKAAKRAARDQKRAAKQAAPANVGPAPADSKALLCMILGILSVVFALIPPVGIVLGFVVRKMSGDYMKQGGTSPKADTGRIFATVGLVFSFIMLAFLVFMGVFIYAGLYGEGPARVWSVFFNNSPFGNIVRIPIPNPLG